MTAVAQSVKPPPKLTASEWADAYRMLSPEASASPGKWRTSFCEYMREIMDAISDPNIHTVIIMSSAQVGKALDIDTPIPTPDGWTRMGDLCVGDVVFDENGKQCNVTYVTDVMHNRKCYDMTFSDGSYIKCDADHQWTFDLSKHGKDVGKKTMTTSEMVDIYKTGNRNNIAISTTLPIDAPYRDLPVDPYFLGAWIGDGHSYSTIIYTSEDDSKIMVDNFNKIGLDTKIRCDSRNCWSILVKNNKVSGSLGIRLREIGAMPYASEDRVTKKHIPQSYLRACIDQRYELLRGLMDTDGSIDSRGRCEYVTTNEDIADGFSELITSLGFKSVREYKKTSCMYKGKKVTGKAIRFSFIAYDDTPVFKIPRKLCRQKSMDGCRVSETKRRRITDISETDSVPVKCITVDSENSLYLAGKDMIPTHNTELLLNILGYFVHQDPSPILLLQPTLDMAKAFSNDRLKPMVRDTKVLTNKIAKNRSGGNTILHKSFAGGHITMAGANSPASLASRPIRVLLCDEVDRYELSAGTEGDPIGLAEKRCTTFFNAKKIYVSTPGNNESSRIEPLFLLGDQRHHHMPCPHCGVYQKFVFPNIVFEKGDLEQTTYYRCAECSGHILSRHKRKMIDKGIWVPSSESDGIASFHMNELSSPWVPFHKTVENFLKATGKQEELKVFINTALGETWKEKGETPDWRRLYERREHWDINVVPKRALRLTAAIDVQRNRLEMEIKGWGRNGESWTHDYYVFPGETSDIESTTSAWREVEKIMEKEWDHELGGKIRIHRTAVDSSDQTMIVYQWARKQGSKVCSVKGQQNLGTAIGIPTQQEIRMDGKKTKRGVMLWRVGTDVSKENIYGRLSLDKPTEEEERVGGFPFGYMHFPDYLDEEFFKMLCSEKLVRRKNKKGYIERIWEKVRDRNEVLDTNVYNYAMYYRNRYNNYKEEDWQEIEKQLGKSVKEIREDEIVKPVGKEPIAKRSGGYKIVKKKSNHRFWSK